MRRLGGCPSQALFESTGGVARRVVMSWVFERGACIVCLASLLLSGCTARPRAPALQNETVYQNSQEGFRFLPPPEWTQQARAEFPAGSVPEKRLLVEYKCFTSAKPASLDVSMLDVPKDKSLIECVRDPGAEGDWQTVEQPVEFQVGGRPAARGSFASTQGGEPRSCELVAVRRGSDGRFVVIVAARAPGDGGREHSIGYFYDRRDDTTRRIELAGKILNHVGWVKQDSSTQALLAVSGEGNIGPNGQYFVADPTTGKCAPADPPPHARCEPGNVGSSVGARIDENQGRAQTVKMKLPFANKKEKTVCTFSPDSRWVLWQSADEGLFLGKVVRAERER